LVSFFAEMCGKSPWHEYVTSFTYFFTFSKRFIKDFDY